MARAKMDKLAELEASKLKWPAESVCGFDWCPKLKGAYCLECHSVAYAAMWQARSNLLALLCRTTPALVADACKDL